ncbi:uncharacterized protein L969DRAFT_78007 [Mixia osmundae IAM 14324]|uniref:Kinetochore protein Spc24 n=1 Tax=Mixia osmundae (strain CBS 9802 / IAM 14324 / JCM 22182 / KY 12970) TaxID=764103 RepID=G7E4T6_MIXOS|nr:uncharacterized protein L969DRAFT_78007 [Mixia osmundae IAM 14324]KEI37708.1 hypothetical protein L969DRAFT_78007 [Mixia osmundae IAM 14324]GAA97846.1 hypothetical protein E5Q_04526 [Mixia osmundae IAM 14324]
MNPEMSGESEMLKLASSARALLADADDSTKLASALEALERREVEQQQEAQGRRKAVQELEQQLAHQLLSTARPAHLPSERDQEAKLSSLQSTNYTLGKTIADLEQRLGRSQAALEKLRSDTHALPSQIGRNAVSLDDIGPEALQLKLYRSIGFTLLATRDDPRTWSRMLLRSDRTRQTHELNLNTRGMSSDYEQAQAIWDKL